VSLAHRPADEGILLAQIEDVVLVDPGRDDDQRPLQHLGGHRLVLDELHQVVLEHHAAGRGGDVLAELEAFSSVIEICSCPPPFSMSASRLLRPRTRFWPPLATRLAQALRVW